MIGKEANSISVFVICFTEYKTAFFLIPDSSLCKNTFAFMQFT